MGVVQCFAVLQDALSRIEQRLSEERRSDGLTIDDMLVASALSSPDLFLSVAIPGCSARNAEAHI